MGLNGEAWESKNGGNGEARGFIPLSLSEKATELAVQLEKQRGEVDTLEDQTQEQGNK